MKDRVELTDNEKLINNFLRSIISKKKVLYPLPKSGKPTMAVSVKDIFSEWESFMKLWEDNNGKVRFTK